MKCRIRARLIAISLWSVALVTVAAAGTVCSSCGKDQTAAAQMRCAPTR